jgi:TM2 domain-containing membrane protein YozV
MKGSILDFSVQANTGIISGDDQQRYQFTGRDWHGYASPLRGQRVDFEDNGQGHALNIYLIAAANPLTSQVGQKNRIVAALLAFFLGGFGAHKFYLGRIGWGILYLLFFWTLIPGIIAFVEFIIYLCTSDEDFARKYG